MSTTRSLTLDTLTRHPSTTPTRIATFTPGSRYEDGEYFISISAVKDAGSLTVTMKQGLDDAEMIIPVKTFKTLVLFALEGETP